VTCPIVAIGDQADPRMRVLRTRGAPVRRRLPCWQVAPRALTSRSWRWGESNPRPSAAHQGFSGCSLLQFSQPQRSRRQDAAGSVTVWFPYRSRDRSDRWSPLSMPGPRARAHLGWQLSYRQAARASRLLSAFI